MNALKTEEKQVLLLCIGNAGRADDGLGWLFADRVNQQFGEAFTVEYRYQLQVEDAELVSRFQEVYFVDATETFYDAGFSLERCIPAETYFYSSHLQSPEAILYLCANLFDKRPTAWLLSISGVDWMLGNAMSAEAFSNFESAWKSWCRLFFRKALAKSYFHNMNYRAIVTPALLLLLNSRATAHSGHGHTDGESLLHYLAEPIHLVVLLTAVIILALLGHRFIVHKEAVEPEYNKKDA